MSDRDRARGAEGDKTRMADKADGYTLGIPFQVTAYQCSRCKFQSALKNVVANHLKRANNPCGDANILQQKFTFTPGGEPVGQPHQSVTLEGDNNIVNQTINNFVIVPNMASVGSNEEHQALVDLLKRPDTLAMLSNLPASEIPATVFRLWKGADAPPELKNIRVVGDKVEEIRHGNRVVAVPRTRFVKQTVGDLFTTVDSVVDSVGPSSSVAEIKDELHSKRFRCGKRHVTNREAAHMYTSGCKHQYALDADGRAFIAKTARGVDKELDYID